MSTSRGHTVALGPGPQPARPGPGVFQGLGTYDSVCAFARGGEGGFRGLLCEGLGES